jgi:hypothetical protein
MLPAAVGPPWAPSVRGSLGDAVSRVRMIKVGGDAPGGQLSARCRDVLGGAACSPGVIAAQRDGQQDQRCQLDSGDGGDQSG